MADVALAVLALMAVALAVFLLGWLLGRRHGRSVAAAARTDAVLAAGQLTDARVQTAAATARWEAARDQVAQLAEVLAAAEAKVATFERVQARQDQEFRHVSLLAARLPVLEERLAHAEVRAGRVDDLARRVAELEPLADEIDLRDQYIETMHRQLVHRDERILALDSGVSRLERRNGPEPGARIASGRDAAATAAVAPS